MQEDCDERSMTDEIIKNLVDHIERLRTLGKLGRKED